MSGALDMQTAIAAAGHALVARAAAYGVSPRKLAVLEAKAKLMDAQEAKAKAHKTTPQAQAWAAIPHRCRVVLLNLGARSEGDNFTRARQPWESFSREDRDSMARVREELLQGLKGADALSW